MRTLVVAVGTRMPQWVAAGFEEYARRMPRASRFELVEIKPEKRTVGMDAARVLAREAQRIEAALPPGCTRVLLDERAAALSSVQLAARLSAWRARGSDLAFLIGGAEGLAGTLKATAAAAISLSAMTLPHGLARVFLAEQLYRAHTIASGHPYHRE